EDRARWEVIAKELGQARQQTEARKTAARADFQKWLAAARPEQILAQLPGDELRLHAPLSDGPRKTLRLGVEGEERMVPTNRGIGWDAGHVAAKGFKSQPGGTLEVPDAGDLERDEAFSFGAWVRLPRRGTMGPVFARMDDKNDYRGWDLWVEG